MLDRLIDLLVASLQCFQCWVVVDEYERAVLLRFGRYVRVLEPGLHWCLPFHVDRALHANVVPRTERLSGLATTTKDGRAIAFDAVITCRIHNPRKAILECEDMKDAIADSCAGVIGTALSESNWDEIWHGKVTDGLKEVCREGGFKWGVEILRVQLIGVTPVKTLRLAIAGTQSHIDVEHSM